MLYVTTNQKLYEWEIGDKTSLILNIVDNIKNIMVSGDELELIKERFGIEVEGLIENVRLYSIPMAQGGDIIWYGDIAKTIVSNIMI